mgnify:CR=1 FL=1
MIAGNGVYICVNFLPSLIYGSADSVVRRDYVDPVLNCDNLQSFPLLEEAWHREICGLLQELGEYFRKRREIADYPDEASPLLHDVF